MARSRTFASSLKGAKVDNAERGFKAKIEIRRNVLAAIGEAHVFDAFAGEGRMFAHVWKDAASYVGCDLAWHPDRRLAYVADNRRVLRCLDLRRFNLFDLDAYGSPWEQAYIIARRRPVRQGETVGLVLTEGTGLKLKLGGWPKALLAVTGLSGRPAGGAKNQDETIMLAVRNLAGMMGCEVQRLWRARGATGSAMRYLGLVLVGRG